MTFPADAMITRSAAPLATEIDGEVVMLDIESGSYFNLDAIGAAIWAQIETPIAFANLCEGLHRAYAAPLEIIQRDVSALLVEMQAHKLVSVSAP